MSALLKCGAVALGCLALSCSGVNLPPSVRKVTDPIQTLGASKEQLAECEKLRTPPSEKEEYTLGGAVAINWVHRSGGLVPLEKGSLNEQLVRYLNVVGKNLGAQSGRPTLRWTFGILQSEESFNAVSAPGGYVFVTRKLLRGVENEAQLAGVLAHEIAHVTSRHVLSRYADTKVGECSRAASLSSAAETGKQLSSYLPQALSNQLLAHGKSGGGPLDLDHQVALLSGLTDSLVENLADVGFGKEDEFSADEQAVRLMVSAGYEPREYIEFLAKIPDSRGVFAHHPSKKDRVKRLVALLNSNPGSDSEFSEFPAATAGLVQPALPPEFSSALAANAP